MVMSFIKYGRYIATIRTYVRKGSYPRRRANSIKRMSKALKDDKAFNEGIPECRLMVKKFWPSYKLNVNPVYSKLIYTISTYFNVYSVWVYKMIPGTNEPIRTVWHFGYKEDVMLAARYIANEINNLETIKLIKQERYRQRKKRGRRRNYKVKTADARTKAIALRDKYLLELLGYWENALKEKPVNPMAEQKYKTIAEYITQHIELDYKKFRRKTKPTFKNAFCRKGHYRKNSVIQG